MVSWLVDHAAVVYLLLGIAALMLGSLWWMNRKRPYLYALAAVGALILLVWIVGRFVATDRTRLVSNVNDMARAIGQRKLDTFFQHVSASFDHGGMDARQFRQYMDSQLQRYGITSFSVSNLVVEEVSRQTGTAKVGFWIHVEGNWEGQTVPLRCEAAFVREQDDWRLKGFRLFLGNSGNEFRLPH